MLRQTSQYSMVPHGGPWLYAREQPGVGSMRRPDLMALPSPPPRIPRVLNEPNSVTYTTHMANDVIHTTPPQGVGVPRAPSTVPKPRAMEVDEEVYDPYSGDFHAISKYLATHHPDKFQRQVNVDGTWNGRVFVKETTSGYPTLSAPSLRMKGWPTRVPLNQCFKVEDLHEAPTHLDGDLSRGFQLLDCDFKDGGNANFFLNDKEVMFRVGMREGIGKDRGRR